MLPGLSRGCEELTGFAIAMCSVWLLTPFWVRQSSYTHPFSHLCLQIFGGLVWILIAASKVLYPIVLGWVMFVSVFCFVMTATLLFLYMCGAHGGSSSWVTLVSGRSKPQG